MCAQVCLALYMHMYTRPTGWKKIIDIDYTGVSVLLECIHLIHWWQLGNIVWEFGDQVCLQTPDRPCLKQQVIAVLCPAVLVISAPESLEWCSLGFGLESYRWKGSSLWPEAELLAQKQEEQSCKDSEGEVLEIFQWQLSCTEIIIISFHLQILLLFVIWNFIRKDSGESVLFKPSGSWKLL